MKKDLYCILTDGVTDTSKIIPDSGEYFRTEKINTEKIIASVLKKANIKKDPRAKIKTLYKRIGVVAACFILVIGTVTALRLSGILDFSSPEITDDILVNLDDKNIVWKNTAETGAAVNTEAIHEVILDENGNEIKKENFAATGTLDASKYSFYWNGLILEPDFYFMLIENESDITAIYALYAGLPTDSVAEIYDPEKPIRDFEFFLDLGIDTMLGEDRNNVYIFVTAEELKALGECDGIENYRFSLASRDEVGFFSDTAIEPEYDDGNENHIPDNGLISMVTEGFMETVPHEAVDEYLYSSNDEISTETGMTTPSYDPNK